MAWAVVGLGTVLYLFYAELFRIDAVCLWCTSVHVQALILFGSTLLATLMHPPMESGESNVVPTGEDGSRRSARRGKKAVVHDYAE
jgi:hypothetical protein